MPTTAAGRRNFNDLTQRLDPESMERARQELHDLDAHTPCSLAELRSACGITQVELAERLERSQAQVSRVEHGTDPHVSTLAHYVDALGAQLNLLVTLPNGESVTLDLQATHDALLPGSLVAGYDEQP